MMKKLFTVLALTPLFVLAAPAAIAQQGGADKHKGQGVEQMERARSEKSEKSRKVKEHKEKIRDDADMEDDADMKEEAGGRGQEMRERRDERKQIMDEYKGERDTGDEDEEMDAAADQVDDTKAKGKKPWWKFWGN